jgi:hypothetical protein
MGTKIWKIEFGYNVDSVDLVAKTIEEAIEKAKKLYADEMKGAGADDYWISKVRIIAESDEEEGK